MIDNFRAVINIRRDLAQDAYCCRSCARLAATVGCVLAWAVLWPFARFPQLWWGVGWGPEEIIISWPVQAVKK